MPVLTPTERMVKCPTAHCPGWLTVDDRRPQTVPCRYCRVTVHTLAYLLSQGDVAAPGGDDALAVDLHAPALHAAFNGLMLALAGATGGNVYLRPTDRALVALTGGPRGVIIEYNGALAARVSAAALVGLLAHWLLHVDLHPRSERVWRAEPKPGGRQDLPWLPNYLPPILDHAWLETIMDARLPGLRAALAAWGLDVALLLAGNESFFPPFLRERNLRWLAEASAAPDLTAAAFRAALGERLAGLATEYFGRAREETNRLALALQIADLHGRNPAAGDTFVAALEAAEALNLREALPLAERLERALTEARTATLRPDGNAFKQVLDEALKALNVHTAFDVRLVKAE